MPILESIPPKFSVLIGPDKASFTLEAIAAIGDEAAAMCRDFAAGRDAKVQTALTDARQAFLESAKWQSVVLLRNRLTEVSGFADAADAVLNKIRGEYAENLRNGDPISLLSEMSLRQIQSEQARKARDDLDREVIQLEREAERAMRDQIDNAYRQLQWDARSEYSRRLDKLVSSVDKRQLVALAVLENIALSGSSTMAMPFATGKADGKAEAQGYGDLPARPFTVTHDSSWTPPSPPPSEQWGPSAIEYPDDNPPQWGPGEVERII